MFEELLKVTNKKYSLKPERFYEIKRKYLSLYKSQLLKMYDLGYTEEVSVYKESDFLQAYSDEGIHLRFKEGKIKLEPWVFYVEWLLSGKKNDFYYDMKELLEYRDACLSIDIIYDNVKMYKAKSTKPLTWGITFGYSGMRGISRSTALGRYGYDLLIKDEQYIKEEELTPLVSIAISKELDKDLSAIEVLRGVSLYDLGEYVEEVLYGGIILEGKDLVSLLNSKLSYSEVISDLLHRYSKDIESYLESLNIKDDETVIGISNTHLYRVLDKSRSYREKIPFGAFSVDYDSGKVLSSLNNYYGVTGDFVSLDSPIFTEEGANYVGCPIYLYGLDGEKSLYLDVEQVSGLGESSLIFDLGLELSFNLSGSYSLKNELSLVDYYVNSKELAEEGLFFRYLTGNYSSSEKDIAIRKAAMLLGDV